MATSMQAVRVLFVYQLLGAFGTQFKRLQPSKDGALGCASDAECSFEGSGARGRCCPVGEGISDGCPDAKTNSGPVADCMIDRGMAKCTCSVPLSCTEHDLYYPYAPAELGKKQWLLIGDSISQGVHYVMKKKGNVTELGFQLSHTPGNAKNVWWGAQCLDAWLGDAKRWDIIFFNFGLHDISLTNERIEPEKYGELIGTIGRRLREAAPQAKLLFGTTTPVPNRVDAACWNETDGGCPPRRTEDVTMYNDIALKALTPLNVATVDLHAVVTSRCGTNYEDCPGFALKPRNVHFTKEGYESLAEAYLDAAAIEMGMHVDIP